MAQNIGASTTAQSISEGRLIRRVDQKIYLVEPDEGPLVTLLNAINNREATDNVKYEWIEDDFIARWATLSSTPVADGAGDTTVIVTDGTLFVKGDQFFAPRADSTVPEVLRVTDISANTLTVERDLGSTGRQAIAANANLKIIGPAYEEMDVPPDSKYTSPVTYFNYVQPFRTSMATSWEKSASKHYGSEDERMREEKKKMVEHKRKMNDSFMWGARSLDLTGSKTNNPFRTTGGINARIITNVTDMGGMLTPKKLDIFAETAFRYGSKEKYLFVSGRVLTAVGSWGKKYCQLRTRDTTFGMNITTIVTPHGTWNVVRDFSLESPGTGYGFQGWAFSLDLDAIKYRYLSGNGNNYDTHVRSDAVKDGRGGWVDEIVTIAGVQLRNESWHAKFYGATDWID